MLDIYRHRAWGFLSFWTNERRPIMALLVDKRKMYERTVKDPEDGSEYIVRLRKMTEGDSQRRSDQATRARIAARGKGEKKGNEDTLMEYAFGAIRQFDLETSIVGWDFPFPLDKKHISRLDPDVADQIHDHIEELNPFIFQGREDEDDELPEGDEDDDLIDNPNPHEVVTEQIYADEEGPTELAAEN
jgi:hypothetical protein